MKFKKYGFAPSTKKAVSTTFVLFLVFFLTGVCYGFTFSSNLRANLVSSFFVSAFFAFLMGVGILAVEKDKEDEEARAWHPESCEVKQK